MINLRIQVIIGLVVLLGVVAGIFFGGGVSLLVNR